MKREEEKQIAAEEYATGSPNATLRHKAFTDGAKYADRHPAKKQTATIDAWVAMDKNKIIALHRVKPKCWEGFYLGSVMAILDKNDFPEVTFENSPKKVKVTIELEEEE